MWTKPRPELNVFKKCLISKHVLKGYVLCTVTNLKEQYLIQKNIYARIGSSEYRYIIPILGYGRRHGRDLSWKSQSEGEPSIILVFRFHLVHSAAIDIIPIKVQTIFDSRSIGIGFSTSWGSVLASICIRNSSTSEWNNNGGATNV